MKRAYSIPSMRIVLLRQHSMLCVSRLTSGSEQLEWATDGIDADNQR